MHHYFFFFKKLEFGSFQDLHYEIWTGTGLELGACFAGKRQTLLLTEPSCRDSRGAAAQLCHKRSFPKIPALLQAQLLSPAAHTMVCDTAAPECGLKIL